MLSDTQTTQYCEAGLQMLQPSAGVAMAIWALAC